jgi:hypothetical protein
MARMLMPMDSGLQVSAGMSEYLADFGKGFRSRPERDEFQACHARGVVSGLRFSSSPRALRGDK